MSLYNKYRPQNLDELIGNEETISSLTNLLSKDNPPQVYLLYGDTGCGKTTLARIIAKKLNCTDSDFRELNIADFRGIDTIRDLIEQSHYTPLYSGCKVWVLDEAHQLTKEAQNALLKLLEDTPKNTYFILSTTAPDKLLTTIRGRCIELRLATLNEIQMIKLLRNIVKAEGETLTREIYEQIALDSQGHPRNAIQILEKVLSVELENRLQVAKKEAEKQSQIIELCRALLQATPWKKISHILQGLRNEDPESIRRAVLAYCSTVLLKGDNSQAGIVMEQFIDTFYYSGFSKLVFACYYINKLKGE